MKNVFILILIIMILSCVDHSTNVKNSNNQILPLKVGNKWNMINIEFDSLGNSTSPFHYSFLVDSDTLINNEKWYCLLIVTGANEESSKSYFTSRDEGIYMLDDNNIPILVYKFPANEGDIYDADSLKVSIKSISSKIKVEAGAFTCILYEINEIDQSKTEVYLSKGIGFVLFEHYDKKSDGDYFISQRNELSSYSIQ